VDTDGAAEILGVTPQYVGLLAAQERLPLLPARRSGEKQTRVYRRAQIEVIARARAEGLSDPVTPRRGR
jgi:DNA-binding transcriptional MerR regulator